MDGSTLMVLGVGLLAGLSCIGVAYALFAPQLSGQYATKRRVAAVSGDKSSRVSRANEGAQKRKQVLEALKDMEEKQKLQRKKKKDVLTLRMSIEQAGLELDIKTFWIAAAVSGVAVFFITLMMRQSLVVALGLSFVGVFGLPRWVLGVLRSQRQKKFIAEFPNALDVIIRGVKAGLPLNDCMQIIARESPPPVSEEFRMVVDGQRLGMTLEEALDRLYKRMPTPEVNFFSIVLAIQAKTGGNLSEALRNLSSVLRARKQLRAKVQSMSAEAKTGALIIGSLPFLVGFAMYSISPKYMDTLLYTQIGHIVLFGCFVWMSFGGLMMRQMINFKI